MKQKNRAFENGARVLAQRVQGTKRQQPNPPKAGVVTLPPHKSPSFVRLSCEREQYQLDESTKHSNSRESSVPNIGVLWAASWRERELF